MSRKDYVMTARIIRALIESGTIDDFALMVMVREFSQWFAEDNARFDSERFAIACGMESVSR